MAEVFMEFNELILAPEGGVYIARACGRPTEEGRWEGWIEFVSGDEPPLRTPRETVQPKRGDLAYWATGLTSIYLEGALARALEAVQPAAPAL